MAVKVSQKTIDEIKKMGMTKALASAKTRRSPEFQEALRRMYGQRRLDAAMKGATGGSASRETYMKRGYSSRPTSSGKSAPVKKGGGQGYKGTPKSQQQSRNRSRAGAVASAAGAAGGVAAGRSLSRNIKAGQARTSVVNKANKSGMLTQKAFKAKGVSKAAAAKNVMPTASRAAMTAASRLGLVGAAGVMAYKGAQKAKQQADKAGRKVKAAGSGRTSAMASSIKRNRKRGK